MRVLTDDPARAAQFLGGCIVGRWHQDLLDTRESDLAAALGLDRVLGVDVHGRGAFWTTLTIVSEAPKSQFAALDQLVGAGYHLPGPVASLAFSGRHFRGQRDREWIGAEGNLHLSVALPVHMRTSHAGAGLAMVPSLAVVDAVFAATGGTIRPAIKWVNDVVLDGRKVAGVLTAAHITGDSFEDVIWGIGVNLAVVPAVAPTPFVPGAICLRGIPGGERVSLPMLFWAVLAAIETRFAELTGDGVSPVFNAYHANSVILGRPVSVWDETDCHHADPARWGRPLAQGVVTAIQEDLGLRVEGRSQIIRQGRLALCDAAVTRLLDPIEPVHA